MKTAAMERVILGSEVMYQLTLLRKRNGLLTNLGEQSGNLGEKRGHLSLVLSC